MRTVLDTVSSQQQEQGQQQGQEQEQDGMQGHLLSVTQFTPDTRCSLQQAAVMQSCRTLAIPVNYEVKFYFWGQLPPPGQ